MSDKRILKGINIDVNKNEVVGIVGENGSGKTTLCNVIGGLLTPSSGEIYLNAQRTSPMERRNNVFITYVDFSRYPLTLDENITLSDQEIPDSLYEIVGDIKKITKGKMIGKGFKNSVDLSTGQWQRVAIARAIHSNKPILIFDEPTASMDPVSELNIINKIIELARGGFIIIIVAHRASAVMNCDRVLVMKDGGIIQDGKPNELLEVPGLFHEMYQQQMELLKNKSPDNKSVS